MPPLMMPAAWSHPDRKRKAYDVIADFQNRYNREPTAAEFACLKKCVDKAKHGIAIGRNGEAEYQHGWYAAEKVLQKGRCLTEREWGFAGKHANEVVNYYKAKWAHDHPSGPFAWISKAVKAAGKVFGKIAKVALPIAKLIPFVGQGVAAVEGLSAIGSSIISASKVLTAGSKLVPHTDLAGFKVGAALMHHANLTPQDIIKTRNQMNPEQKRGFDTAVSITSGIATSKPPPKMQDPTERAGFFITQGLQGATPTMKTGILKEVTKNPKARKGAIVAAKEIKDKSLWQHIKEYLGFHDIKVAIPAAAKVSPKKLPPKRAA